VKLYGTEFQKCSIAGRSRCSE